MDILEILLSSIKNNRIAHAYLFDGSANSDKLQSALLFAQALLCNNNDAVTGKGCGTCKNCMMFKNNSHPDYHFLTVDGETIKVREHVEPFFQDIRLASPYNCKKVYIINEAQKMNAASQNSILKTLEEPFSDVVIILLSENSNALLSTILSRVIKYNFAVTAEEDVSEEIKEIFFKIIHGVESPKASDRISASLELAEQKDLQKDLLYLMQIYYRNSLVAKYTNKEMLINGFKTDRISAEGASLAVKIIEETLFALKSNANAALAMDVLVTKLREVYL